MKPIKLRLSLLFLLLASKSFNAESKCNKTCDLALASYHPMKDSNLTYISEIMKSNLVSQPEDIFIYSTDTMPNQNFVRASSRVNVPFPCDCINDEFLGHTFLYKAQHGDVYASIAEWTFSNLTTEEWMQRLNSYSPNNIPDNVTLNVTVNCSCGNREVSTDYSLFITYPLRSEDSLESIAKDTEIEAELLQRYNPGVDFSQGHGLVFIPGKGREAMAWSTRMQIALDVARGLEYIHEHSVPVYIHRDIKPDNILLNENFTAKIADFGVTRLTDIANSTDQTHHMAGTFGYMPPENAYGHISRKIDVYAFGVVLYELISAKAAVIKIDKTEFKSLEITTNESIDEYYMSLVALFDEAIDQERDPIGSLRKLVDPRLGDNYSIDSIIKMAQLAKACINQDPKRRPTMRAVVVFLMTLNSTIDDGSSTDNAALTLAMEHD